METTKIPGLDLSCGRIGLGTWAIGGWLWGGTDEKDSIRTVHAALERGMNLIDTAPVYGFGLSEEIVGKAMAQHGKRDRIVLSTKAGIQWKDGKPFRNSSPDRIQKEVEDSLRRLSVDYIDLYHIHWPDPSVPYETTAETMHRLKRAGKIRTIAVSNYDPEQMDRFRKSTEISACQPPYNLFERGIDQNVLPYCRENRIATLAYGSICRGLLSGKMTPQTRFEGDDLRTFDPKFAQPRYGQYLEAVRRLDELARDRFGKRVIHLAMRWVLDQGVEVALLGARRPEQLAPVTEVMSFRVDKDGLEAIDRILAEAIQDPVGPEFMAPPLPETGA